MLPLEEISLARSDDLCQAFAATMNLLMTRRVHDDVQVREYLRTVRDLSSDLARAHGGLLAQYEMQAGR